jgi:hypothetical protein
VGLETPQMSENNIPHVVDTGASIMPHENMSFVIQPPKKAGCWIIGGDFHVYVKEKATDAQIKATEEMFGWKWKDGEI